MHAAPPVRVALGRSRGWMAFVAIVFALAAVQFVSWLAQRGEWPFAAAAAAVASSAALAALAGAFWMHRAQPPGVLAFDGHAWQWNDRPGEIQVAIDLRGWILLRFDPAAPPGRRREWIVASRTGAGHAWPVVRAALYSSRGDEGDPAAPMTPPG